ncbi:unnamed protein product [Linum tenue]|uniref:Uncharacterized protein n=1 Tax=Linum tenue TaxID=586396 RepID=A0AAV0PUU3_9ROSI|nr:unnamed protein product [Linum tenue]
MESQLAVPCRFRRHRNHHHQNVPRPHWCDFSIYAICFIFVAAGFVTVP